MEIIAKLCTFCFTKKLIIVIAKFHVLLKGNQNNKIKFVVSQNRICGFLL